MASLFCGEGESIPKELITSVAGAGAVQCPCYCWLSTAAGASLESVLESLHTPWLKNTHFWWAQVPVGSQWLTGAGSDAVIYQAACHEIFLVQIKFN